MRDDEAHYDTGREWTAEELLAGHPVLDFVNTVAHHLPQVDGERLESFADLVSWGAATKLLAAGEADALAQRAGRAPLEAAAALGKARQLRAILNRILVALAREEVPDARWLRALNDALGPVIGGMEVTWRDGALAWSAERPDDLDILVRRVAWQAAQFLTSADLTYFRRCEGTNCAWFFLDTTRNHSRRWCSMNDCGAREKARRYYRRKKGREGQVDA